MRLPWLLIPLCYASACVGADLPAPRERPVVVWANEDEAMGNHVRRITKHRAATTHPDADLSVILLSGRIEVDIGDDRLTLDEGESVHVPHGSVYSLHNLAAEPSSVFLMFRAVHGDHLAQSRRAFAP